MTQATPELLPAVGRRTGWSEEVATSAFKRLNHLQALEAESIYILREAAAEFARPVMLYSIGKDSSVMLRLAQKAFFPGKIPFPLLHVDTSYKFPEMIEFRDSYAKEIGAELIVHQNREALEQGANPFALGTQKCCGLLKTKALLDALAAGGFNAAFGGARRDEEKSRAKERIYSFRDSHGQWDPRISARSCGTSLTRGSTKRKAFACSLCQIGPNWTFGFTSTPKRFPSCRFTTHVSERRCCETALSC